MSNRGIQLTGLAGITDQLITVAEATEDNWTKLTLQYFQPVRGCGLQVTNILAYGKNFAGAEKNLKALLVKAAKAQTSGTVTAHRLLGNKNPTGEVSIRAGGTTAGGGFGARPRGNGDVRHRTTSIRPKE